jgi:hypothetical protein
LNSITFFSKERRSFSRDDDNNFGSDDNEFEGTREIDKIKKHKKKEKIFIFIFQFLNSNSQIQSLRRKIMENLDFGQVSSYLKKLFHAVPKRMIIVFSFVVFTIHFLFFPVFSYDFFLYYMYFLLMIGFICYPFRFFVEYQICMTLFFFGFVPLAVHFIHFESKYSLLYLASSFIYLNTTNSNSGSSFPSSENYGGGDVNAIYYLPEMFFMQSVNIFLMLLTIPAFRCISKM